MGFCWKPYKCMQIKLHSLVSSPFSERLSIVQESFAPQKNRAFLLTLLAALYTKDVLLIHQSIIQVLTLIHCKYIQSNYSEIEVHITIVICTSSALWAVKPLECHSRYTIYDRVQKKDRAIFKSVACL